MATGAMTNVGTARSSTASWEMTSGEAWISGFPCPTCGGAQLFRIAAIMDPNLHTLLPGSTQWFRCPGCGAGSVFEHGAMHPKGRPFRVPGSLPPDVRDTWNEARACFGAGAHAAGVLMCRKLLLHIAVAHGLPPKNDKGWAPNFVECVDHLEGAGVVTTLMRAWVERIKDIGNEATHELDPVTAEQGNQVGRYTEQLLVLAYEMPALALAGEDASG